MKNPICDLLKKNSKKIMTLWEKRATKLLFGNLDETSLVLQDSLPEYLDQLADALSKSITRTTKRNKNDKSNSSRVGARHGRERGEFTDYSINQLISEFHILRKVIFEVLEKDGEVAKDARDTIIDSVEQMVNDAATEFSESARNFQEHFSTMVTHDLRSPVAAAKMSAQLIRRQTGLTEVSTQLAARIESNMIRIDSMLKDLLDSSRLRAGKKLELNLEKMDLSHVMGEICRDLNSVYDNKIEVITEPSITACINRQSFWRVIENLVNNAAKFGTKGKKIVIKAKKKNSKVIVSVHNFGKPIPLEKREKLFDTFQQSNIIKKDGWGIGLNVVKGVVEAHQGQVRIESSLNKGTTFFIELPTQLKKEKIAKA